MARHRASRRRWLVPGLAVLLGLGVAGAATAVAVRDDRPADRVSVAAEESARAAAAQRADRSARDAAGTPSTTPTATPTPSATATPTPTATPSRSGGSGKAKAASPTASRKAPAWVNPMPGAAITSCYGMRWGVLHAGIDLAMPADTPIRAAGAGTVVEAGWAYAGYGISVVVDHGNGWLTHYAHQNRTTVGVGDRVKPGQVIGYEGSTGDSTGPHLHFEVHDGLWNQVDPAPWMRDRGVDLGC
ncbi:M23 family metallopeptidase [Micromonospora sp. WMMD1102]|uniref:M23 family metallopeptidase n=1 Tax=Micromonospora sp. WMMD1102 TaxID=3016105 RepID=UPI00241500BF|nr:M23 family metallopeptidase [Micromonospora sp. WMMD1102]MDG4789842.1 M23 family metallopeptidase [Micromonospora sp. WMMD1102]